MNDYFRVDPLRVFDVARAGASEVCTLKSALFDSAPGTNAQIIAAVTGKKIRVMGLTLQSADAAVVAIGFEDGSGGARISSLLYAPPNTGAPFLLPITPSGYFQTSTSTGLFCDIGGAGAGIHVNVFYIEYTP